MKDMLRHLEKLRDQAAECAILAIEAPDKEKREMFIRLTQHLTTLADEVEKSISTLDADNFPGRQIYEPLPKAEE